jgi:hypothetical protein
LEATIENTRIIIDSIYIGTNRPIDLDLLKIETTIAHAKGAGVIIAMYSNYRSTS